MATVDFKNLDDSIEYRLSFNNEKKLWKLDLLNVKNPNDPDVFVDPIFQVEFFKDDFVKRVVERVYDRLMNVKEMKDLIQQKIGSGNYLDVNETKLEAEMAMLEDQTLMANLKKRLYIK